MLRRISGGILVLCVMWGMGAFAQSPKTLYFTNTSLGTNIWALSETSPAGPSDSTTIASNAASTTGWYHLDPGLTDSTADVSEPTSTTPGYNTIWVSATTYNGSFASGSWTFTIRKTDSKSTRVGVFHADIYRTTSQTDQSGSHATFIAHCTDGSDDWTGAAATITVTCTTAGTTTFTNEYLAVRTLENVTTGSTTSATWTLVIEDTTNGLSKLVTPNYTAASVNYPVSPAAACSVSPLSTICKEITYSLTQPSIGVSPAITNPPLRSMHAGPAVTPHVSPSAATQRAMHANVAVGMSFATAASGTKAGANHPVNITAACQLSPSLGVCKERTFSFTQPGVTFSVNATGVKSVAGVNKPVNVTASFHLSPQFCAERGVTFNPQTLHMSPALGVCLTRNFSAEAVTFSASATVVRPTGTGSAVSLNLFTSASTNRNMHGSPVAALHLAPAAGIQRAMHVAGTAAIHDVAALTRKMDFKRPDSASASFAVAATRVRGVNKSAAVSETISPALTRSVGRKVAIPASLSIATAAATRRALHANASVGMQFTTNAVGAGPSSKSRSVVQMLGITPVFSEVEALHTSDAASANFSVNATTLRSVTRGRSEGVHFAAIPSMQRAVSRSMAENVSIGTSAAVSRNPVELMAASVSFTTAASLHTERLLGIGASTTVSPSVNVGVTGSQNVGVTLAFSPAVSDLRSIFRQRFEGLNLAPVGSVSAGRNRGISTSFAIAASLSVSRNLNVRATQTLTTGPISFRATLASQNAVGWENVHFDVAAARKLNAHASLAPSLSIAALLPKPPVGRKNTDVSSVGVGATASVVSGFGRVVTQPVTLAAYVSIAVNGVSLQRRRGMVIGGM